MVSPSSGKSASSSSSLSVATGAAVSMMETAAAAASGGGSLSLNASRFKFLLLVMMSVQNTSVVLVGRYTRAGVKEADSYDVNHLILVTELAKMLLAAALEFHTTGGHLMSSLEQHVFRRPMDALKIMIPSLLYLVQNTLLYVALSNLTAPIFQVTYQGKLVTTALVSVLLLARKYSAQQWTCLVALSLGVAIVVLDEKKGGGKVAEYAGQNLILGLTSVTVACICSALAGVYFEMVLKKTTTDATKEPSASLWMRNIQMAFFSVMISAVQGALKQNDKISTDTGIAPKSYFHGFTAWAWFLISLQAGGGLLVAAVIKYADNVLKGLATGVSVVSSSLLSMALFGTPLGSQFWFGAVLILTSVYWFSNPLPDFILNLQRKSHHHKDTEMRDLIPK